MVVHELSHAGFLIQENGRSGELRIVVHGLHQGDFPETGHLPQWTVVYLFSVTATIYAVPA